MNGLNTKVAGNSFTISETTNSEAAKILGRKSGACIFCRIFLLGAPRISADSSIATENLLYPLEIKLFGRA